ncbi:MAG: rhodanese-like domain-containing protein [Gammaproteobacteria bacterium]|nr:rhodanese-like domain-containing protein [Gammaproteobacteria bacterium]MDE0413047.1 rhodanese-like domain-containing protein [Gammaproteobacteria bacterium]MDE0453854.1 rhodanese-like domain-containing protein [Gammaproteobacteria bacterium]
MTSTITPEQLGERLNSGKQPILIDVREPMEFKQGHIAGARNVPLTALSDVVADYDPNDEIVFVCQSGMRSLQAASFWNSLGYRKAMNLEGGMDAWTAAR